jgi:hypothetical protein
MMRHRNAIPRNKRQEQAKERSLAVLALVRRKGDSVRKASNLYRTTPKTVFRYVGSAFRQDGPGKRYQPTRFDRISRTLNFWNEEGNLVVVTVKDSRIASLIARHPHALTAYARTGDVNVLAPYKNKTFRAGGVTYRFLTDTQIIDRIADADELGIETLYVSALGPQV